GVAQIEGGGTAATHGLTLHQKCFELGHGSSDFFAEAVRKSRHDQGASQRIDLRWLQPLPIEERTHATSAAEHFVAPRIVYRAAQDFSAPLECDRDTEERILVRKVGRAVKRIDDPLPFSRLRPTGCARLLGKNGVLRI